MVTLKAQHPELTFKALVRSESHSKAIESAGATPVIGSFDDHDLISSLAAEADIVLNAADSDNVVLRDDILKGLKKKYDEGKGVGAFIQTSGTALFWAGNDGKYDPDARVWSVRSFIPLPRKGI